MPMKWMATGAAIVAMAALEGTPAAAHHSVEAVVDISKRLQADMVLTKVDWINPHAWFHFSMTRPDGTVVQEVQIEWLSLSGMRQTGIPGPETLKVGQTYRVTYNPNRDGSFGGELVTLEDQTGRVFSVDGGLGPEPGPPAPPPQPLTSIKY